MAMTHSQKSNLTTKLKAFNFKIKAIAKPASQLANKQASLLASKQASLKAIEPFSILHNECRGQNTTKAVISLKC